MSRFGQDKHPHRERPQGGGCGMEGDDVRHCGEINPIIAARE